MFIIGYDVIRCESKDLKYTECPAGGTVLSVVPEGIQSCGGPMCLFGSTFGGNRDNVWVDKGCCEIFIVTFDGRCVLHG